MGKEIFNIPNYLPGRERQILLQMMKMDEHTMISQLIGLSVSWSISQSVSRLVC